LMAGEVDDLLARGFDRFQDRDRTLVKQLPGRGRFDPARMPQQERDAEIFLEIAYLQAEGGLRDIELLGRGGETADLAAHHDMSALAVVARRLHSAAVPGPAA